MKTRLIIGLASIVYFSIFLTSCYYDEVLPVTVEAITEDVSFLSGIVPILNASCNTSGCHNVGGTPPDLTAPNAYGQLKALNLINTSNPAASGLYQWMAGNEELPMPISGSKPDYNALVLAWIQQGALDN